MLDRNKTAPDLGAEISKVLRDAKVETPMNNSTSSIPLEKREGYIIEAFSKIMHLLGLSPEDDSLCDTPRRVAKMYLNELFWGLDYNNFPKITAVENKMSYESMLIERHIKVNSTCEHHFLPIMGEAFIAYIPNERVIGLSKINRVVEFFCRRPQIQERLCEQIYFALRHILATEDVAVLIKAEHSCVKLRGIEDVNSDTITCRLGGVFYEGELKQEFYQLINMG